MAEYHLHLETLRKRPGHLHLTQEAWDAAAARHPELAKRLRVTVGYDDEMLDEALKTADFIVSSFSPRARLRENAPKLKWIQTPGAGIDALLPLDWLPADITLTNNRGAHGDKVHDSCALALLAIHTRLPEMFANQRHRAWHQLLTAPIAGRTALILGFGDLGQGAARAAHALGLRVLAVTRSGRAGPPAARAYCVSAIDEVLPEADFVVITTPLTQETRGVLNRSRLDMLKRDAGVINFGRAGIVDYSALRRKLERDELAGAVLDVFDQEPLPADSLLWSTPNLIVMPHVSCDTPGYVDRLFDRWFENFKRFLASQPLQNVVDREHGY
jgi:phosphoglycerate dehydrogenase-like enzyme